MLRVSITEAAKLFGINEMTVRRAIKDGKVTYAVVGGRYKINFESLLKWSEEQTRVRQKLATRGLGQYVAQWKIKNRLYSPNPQLLGSDQPSDDTSESKHQLPSP